MWLLIIIIIALDGNTSVVLETFSSKYDCLQAKERVSEGMIDAYPDDTTFKIECQPVPAKA